MVRRNDLQIVHLQTLPQFGLIRLVTQRRSHYILRAVKSWFVVVIQREKEILRTGFGKSRNAAIAGLADLVERISARQVNNVNRRLRHFSDRDCAMHALSFRDSWSS